MPSGGQDAMLEDCQASTLQVEQFNIHGRSLRKIKLDAERAATWVRTHGNDARSDHLGWLNSNWRPYDHRRPACHFNKPVPVHHERICCSIKSHDSISEPGHLRLRHQPRSINASRPLQHDPIRAQSRKAPIQAYSIRHPIGSKLRNASGRRHRIVTALTQGPNRSAALSRQ